MKRGQREDLERLMKGFFGYTLSPHPHVCWEDPQGAQGNWSCSKELQEAITLPQPNGTQVWGVTSVKWGQRVLLHWIQPTVLGLMLFGRLLNNQGGPDGRSQHEHVQSSSAQIFMHVNHLQLFLKWNSDSASLGMGPPGDVIDASH